MTVTNSLFFFGTPVSLFLETRPRCQCGPLDRVNIDPLMRQFAVILLRKLVCEAPPELVLAVGTSGSYGRGAHSAMRGISTRPWSSISLAATHGQPCLYFLLIMPTFLVCWPLDICIGCLSFE